MYTYNNGGLQLFMGLCESSACRLDSRGCTRGVPTAGKRVAPLAGSAAVSPGDVQMGRDGAWEGRGEGAAMQILVEHPSSCES